jgi:hypothetical protein
MCRGVIRVWVTLIVGAVVLGVATIGILAGQPIGADWIEAAGTWAVGLVGVLALVVLAFWSNESERRRERQRLQLEANNVFCDVRLAGTHPPGDPEMINVEQLEVKVINYSRRVISGIAYEMPLPGLDSWRVLREAIGPGEPPATETIRGFSPFKEHKDKRHLRGAKFRFSLDGVAWSKQYEQPAQRLPESDAAP